MLSASEKGEKPAAGEGGLRCGGFVLASASSVFLEPELVLLLASSQSGIRCDWRCDWGLDGWRFVLYLNASLKMLNGV